jgi:hypothetical protein
MARPERPVDGTGPLVDLARALRLVREQAGNPGYRELSAKTLYSRETLSAAARGDECPTWDVVKAFASACDPTGAAARRMWHLWEKASQPGRRRRAVRRRPAADGRPVRAAADRAGSMAGPPRADPADTPAQYAWQLRALRAWAGNPGRKEIRNRTGRNLASSTMYDALRPGRVTLPALETVQVIVSACIGAGNPAAEEWTDAWRAIALRDFTGANPQPAAQAPEASWPPTRVARLIRPESVPSPRSGAVGSEALPA